MAGGFRTQKPFLQTNAWQHQKLNALRYNTSQAGSVVPWMDGTTRVAVNLIDFGKYMGPGGGKKGKGVGPLPVGGTNSPGGFKGGGSGKGKGGSKKGGTQHFTVDVAFGICQGPVTIAPSSFVWSSAGVAGFMSVGLNAYSGADGQAADPVMAGLHPPPPVGYSGTCYVTGTPMDLGMSPVIPNLSFEPAGPNAGTGGPQYPRDASPSKVVTRFLCDPRDGADFPLANLDPNIDTLYGDYCVALGLVISPLLTGQTQAQEWLAGLAKLTNTAIVWSGNLLKFIPYGDAQLNSNGTTWTPNLVPEYSLTDDDFLPWHDTQLGQAEENQDDPILLTRSNPADAVNWLTIEYLDRSNFYNSTTIPVFDQGAIDTYSRRTGDNLNGHCFCNGGGAQVAAQIHLQRLQYVRNTYKFKLGWQYGLLEPMDIVLLSGRCGDRHLDLQPVRLTAIDEDENGALTIEAEEIAVALPTCPVALAPPIAPPVGAAAIDGAANSLDDFVGASTVTLSTAQPNDIIWVHVATLDASVAAGGTGTMSPPQVTGITDTAGLVWQRRGAPVFFATPSQPPNAANVENWWARSAQPLVNDVITVRVSGRAANLNLIAFGVSGITTAPSPFDPDPSLPADNRDLSGALTQPEVTLSTASPITMLIMSTDQQAESGLGSLDAGAGWTEIKSIGQTHVGGDLVGGLSYKIVQSPQTGLTALAGAPSDTWVARGDALVVGS